MGKFYLINVMFKDEWGEVMTAKVEVTEPFGTEKCQIQYEEKIMARFPGAYDIHAVKPRGK